MPSFETLKTQLKDGLNCEANALLLINALIARIAEAGTNPEQVQALVNDLQAEKHTLARNLVLGTPGDQRPKIDNALPDAGRPARPGEPPTAGQLPAETPVEPVEPPPAEVEPTV
jgi:hypothetical protein